MSGPNRNEARPSKPRRLRFSLGTLFLLTFAVACYLGLVRVIGDGGFFLAAIVLAPVLICAPWVILLVIEDLRPHKRVHPDADEAFGAQPSQKAESASREPPNRNRNRIRHTRKWRSPFIRYKYD